MSEIKLVLDSNVLVSAALFKGSIARQAFNKATADGQIIMSELVLAELQDVFSRPRFDRYLSAELRKTIDLVVKVTFENLLAKNVDLKSMQIAD